MQYYLIIKERQEDEHWVHQSELPATCSIVPAFVQEELGAETEILREIGVVSDYYNLLHRHNINHYYLCRALSFGERHLTQDEKDKFHLSALKLTYEEAVREYLERGSTKLGRLIANRELPVLHRAHELLNGCR